jgi:proteasome lid subunit RPN8/RPN11
MSEVYTAFILNDSEINRVSEVAVDDEFIEGHGNSMLSICDRHFCRLAPDDEELVCYDILYGDVGNLAGFDIRAHCDSVRSRFLKETASLSYVDGDEWSRVWVHSARGGSPTPATTELFCDLHLCRTADGEWAILIRSEVLDMR